MKASKVLKLLQVTRQTLCRYVKEGKILGKPLPNGYYDYDEESVYKFLDNELHRGAVIYCRVSTPSQKNDLHNQRKQLEEYCAKNGIAVSSVYSDIGSGINFDRKEFQRLLKDIINHKVSRVFITYKDRLSRISFDMFKNLFDEFNCEIVVINDVDDEKLVEKEIFSEIISMLHCFAMKMYSSRRKKKLKNVAEDLSLEDELSNENGK